MKRGTCGRKWGWNGHIWNTNILINAHLIEEKLHFECSWHSPARAGCNSKDETTIEIWIVTFYWAIPCLISSYRVSGSAGRHLVCPLSPQGLFRLKDPLKRMSCPQTERSQWHMNRPRSVRLGCIRADISFPRSERCWNVILHSVSQVAHALVPFSN